MGTTSTTTTTDCVAGIIEVSAAATNGRREHGAFPIGKASWSRCDAATGARGNTGDCPVMYPGPVGRIRACLRTPPYRYVYGTWVPGRPLPAALPTSGSAARAQRGRIGHRARCRQRGALKARRTTRPALSRGELDVSDVGEPGRADVFQGVIG